MFPSCRVRGYEDLFLAEPHPEVPQRPQRSRRAAPQLTQALGGGPGPRRLQALTCEALQRGGRHAGVAHKCIKTPVPQQ